MNCPLCGKRRARRACPALGQQICAVCCGTKRLAEIRCPSDCSYLASAREHPPVAVLRQQQRDGALLLPIVRDFSRRQSELFLLINRVIAEYDPPRLQPLVDRDIVDAATALGSTFDTAARGVIYQHRAESASAERLAAAIHAVVGQAGSGTAFERDVASVLGRIAGAARELGGSPSNDP